MRVAKSPNLVSDYNRPHIFNSLKLCLAKVASPTYCSQAESLAETWVIINANVFIIITAIISTVFTRHTPHTLATETHSELIPGHTFQIYVSGNDSENTRGTHGRTHGRTYGRTYGRPLGRTYGQASGRTHGRAHRAKTYGEHRGERPGDHIGDHIGEHMGDHRASIWITSGQTPEQTYGRTHGRT